MLARLDAEALPLEKVEACTPEETERWRKIQMRRLELLVRACWGDAVSGDLGAIEQARRLLGDQIRVMGVESKTAETPTETSLTEVIELMQLAGYEVRKIDDGERSKTIETSGTDAGDGSAEAEDVAGVGPHQ